MSWLLVFGIFCWLDAVYTVPPPPSPRCILWSQPTSSMRDDYTYTPGIGGHKVHTRAALWNEARTICREEGGHLAIINSVAEANAVTNLFKNAAAVIDSPHPDFASVGFHDLYNEGQYTTIHDQTLPEAGYTNWVRPEAGQADNGGLTENCGSIHKSGVLNDINCSVKFAFICEIAIY